ncbi:MAG: serine/threonine protein kinase [Nostocales cyanobacterium]|nr:MAG: serine/threonine protein kinase [Nostocales cyanobacterium]
MTCCTSCLYSYHLDTSRFCVKCGKLLLLKDRYRPLYPIGSGGFGRTFLAVDEHIPSQPKCVIKQLYFPDTNTASFTKATELFNQEAVRLNELKHPQIPELLAYFQQENQLYLVQELIVGQNLSQELQSQGLFREIDIWQLLKNILPVLQFVHTKNVIHRDIKPANIMRRYGNLDISKSEVTPAITNAELHHQGSTMTVDGIESFNFSERLEKSRKSLSVSKPKSENLSISKSTELVLIDFGVAKQITATALAQTGTTVGSPEYMPPEQMRGKAFPSSDIYSLGVTCIYLLTGISPFELFDVTKNDWCWRDYLLPENPVSERLGQIINKMLQSSISQRYQSATEVLAAIQTEVKPIQKNVNFENSVSSTTGVNYSKLEILLKLKQWQKADEETWFVMRQALAKKESKYFFNSDLEKFPSEDLQIIDYLWTKYSEGYFGFSVQIEIYESFGRDYGKFCEAVGWEITKSSSSANSIQNMLLNLIINPSLPRGNLPSHAWVGGTKPWEHLDALITAFFKT